MRKYLLLSLNLMFFLLLVSCSKKPKDIINSLYEAANKNDVSEILPYVVPDSITPFNKEESQVFADFLSEALGNEPFESVEIEMPEVNDTTTRVKFTVNIQYNDGKFLKEGGTLIKNTEGNWKLGLFNPPGEYNVLFTIEDPATNNHELMRSLQFAYIMTMAQRGIPEYLGMAAVYYKDGILTYKDFDRFLDLTENAAKNGSAEALFQLGDMYYNGVKKKIRKDHTKAFEYMLKSAEAGNVLAMNNVGYFYENGIGTVRNPQEAGKWYHKSAYEGNLDALNNLGNLLISGNGIDKDYYSAFGLFKLAAEGGQVQAMENLSRLYQNGQGTDRDYEQMIYWATKAAENGLVSAMNHIGDIYYEGVGVDKDYDKSFYWYKRSADQKDLYGEYMVGQSYQYGRGVEKDLIQAKNWYRDGWLKSYQPSSRAMHILWDLGIE